MCEPHEDLPRPVFIAAMCAELADWDSAYGEAECERALDEYLEASGWRYGDPRADWCASAACELAREWML